MGSYEKDEEGRFYVLRDGDRPLFAKDNDAVGFVHIDSEYPPSAFRTTPNAASVGSLYLRVMTGENDLMFRAWREAGLTKEKFKVHPNKYRTTNESVTVYYSPSSGRYFRFVGDAEYYVTLDRRNFLCYYDLENEDERYDLDSRGNKLFFRYKPNSDDRYFYTKRNGSIHWILSNNGGELLFYKKTDLLSVYSIDSPIGSIEFSCDVPISQELDSSGNIICFLRRDGVKEYFWYEKGRIVHFDVVREKKRYKKMQSGEKKYFEFDESGCEIDIPTPTVSEERVEETRWVTRLKRNLDYVVFIVSVLLVMTGLMVAVW
jgi:hypothetical protein